MGSRLVDRPPFRACVGAECGIRAGEWGQALKYTSEIKRLLAREFEKTSEDFALFVMQQVYDGRKSISAKKCSED